MAKTNVSLKVRGFVGKIRSNGLRYTPNGKAVLTFTVATSRKEGNDFKSTWYVVNAWNQLAEYLNNQLGPGDLVEVDASAIEAQTYTSKDGKVNTELVIPFARSVDIILSKNGEPQDNVAVDDIDIDEANVADEDVPF